MFKHYLSPDWPAPANVQAICTTRQGGVSQPPWDSFNLALHVGDNPEHVTANRAKLKQRLSLPQEPCWLNQVHSSHVLRVDATLDQIPNQIEADAAYSAKPGKVCAVMTADCLPVLFTDQQGTLVAAAHAGWRGLGAGILENTVTCFAQPDQVIAWLGPAIGPQAFEVGEEVRDQFIQKQAQAAQAFVAGRSGHWYADIYQLARLRLNAIGVTQISGGEFCTYSDAERFYSYRRDKMTGRMACLIWLKSANS